MRPRARWCLAGLVLVAGTSAWAQSRPADNKPGLAETAQKLRDAARKSPLIWDVQTFLDGYIAHMARYYDLNEKQEQYTRELLTQRVKQFLKEYEKDARLLFAEYYDYQVRGEMPTPEAAREFARRAIPLADAIRREIMEGNMQWRKILNEEQLKKHDTDLELMNRQFEAYNVMMQRWADGRVQPSDVGIRETVVPRSINLEDAMTYYVRNFISRFDLDKGQQETAQSVLREAKEEARRYREAHKDEFEEIDRQLKVLTASEPKNDLEELKRVQAEGRKLTARKAELERPLSTDVFNRLKARLDDIPTADQRARHNARQEALLARLRGQGSTRPAGATRPAVPATHPAGETAAVPQADAPDTTP